MDTANVSARWRPGPAARGVLALTSFLWLSAGCVAQPMWDPFAIDADPYATRPDETSKDAKARPGPVDRATIERNHNLANSLDCRPLRLQGNPMAEHLDELLGFIDTSSVCAIDVGCTRQTSLYVPRTFGVTLYVPLGIVLGVLAALGQAGGYVLSKMAMNTGAKYTGRRLEVAHPTAS